MVDASPANLSSARSSSLGQRRVLAANHQGYSRWVRILRIALPVAALVLIGVLFLWPTAQPQKKIVIPKQLPQVTMEQAHFTGTDDANQPFSIKAAHAKQLPDRLAIVDLRSLEADMQLNDGTQITGAAQIGRFDQAQKRLWLGGDVVLTDSKGNRFLTSELNVDMPGKVVWTDRPARLTGDFGVIEGEGFRAYDGGRLVIFTGHSRATLASGNTTRKN
jgi:lipopolysaccharide export system protein LptC